MQIFLDTADLKLIKEYNEWGVVDGVTTNPTWIAQEGVDLKERILEIAEVVDGPISAEVCEGTAEQMIKEAREIASWHPNVVVKVPITVEGLKALAVMSAEEIKTNTTLCFSLTQALLVAKAGATYVSPFVGRYSEMGGDGVGLVADIVEAFIDYGYETQVLAASFRNLDQIKGCIRAGADVLTLHPKFLDEMISHKMTNYGLEVFAKDCALAAKLKKKKKK